MDGGHVIDDVMDSDAVRVRVRLRSEAGRPDEELLWASHAGGRGPVAGHPVAGTYQLRAHGFLISLAAGDLVRAEPDGHGGLVVVDIERPAPAIMTLVGRVWGAAIDLDEVLDRWERAGARLTEARAGALATTWADDMTPEAVLEAMHPDLLAGTLELLEITPPELRTRAALEGAVDFDGGTGVF